MTEERKRFENVVARYLECKSEIDSLKKKLDECQSELIDILGENGSDTTKAGVKVKVTPPSVNMRFDSKRYLKDHPEAKGGYMVESKREASVRVTPPKAGELDEWGWEV